MEWKSALGLMAFWQKPAPAPAEPLITKDIRHISGFAPDHELYDK